MSFTSVNFGADSDEVAGRQRSKKEYFSLAEMNGAIEELLDKLNHRPFRKREDSRASLFTDLDCPALQPLPAERYVLAHWKTVRASIDYHVEIERHYYSVPYQLAGRKLEARYTNTAVEILHRGTVWLRMRAVLPPTGPLP